MFFKRLSLLQCKLLRKISFNFMNIFNKTPKHSFAFKNMHTFSSHPSRGPGCVDIVHLRARGGESWCVLGTEGRPALAWVAGSERTAVQDGLGEGGRSRASQDLVA